MEKSRHGSSARSLGLLNKDDELNSHRHWNTYEEVNAWANYEKTGEKARPLDRSRHRDAGVGDLLQLSKHRNARVAELLQQRSRHGRTFQQEEDEEQPRRRVDWTKAFSKNGSRHFHIEENVKTGLPINVKKAIRDTFGVYFRGEFEDTVERKGPKMAILQKFHFMYGTMPWLQPWIVANLPCPDLFLFIELYLRGIGQVYFQNSPLSGLLMLIGLFWQSSRVATHGVISLVCGNLVALLLGFDRGLIRSGLFGYNSVLVGLCLATFHNGETHTGWSTSVPVASAIYGGFSSILFVFMGKLLVPYKTPPLTLPFCFASLMFLSGTANMANVNFDSVVEPSLPVYDGESPPRTIEGSDFAQGVIRSIGQVFLADKIVSAVLVFVGIAVCSRISAIAALLGAIIGSLVSLLVGVSADGIENGLFGFSASLTATGMFLFYVPGYGTTLLAALAAVMTSLAQQSLVTFLVPFGLPVLTLPFCVVSLPFIILQGTTNIMIAVPLESITIAEDHLAKVQALRKGFGYLETMLESEHSRKRSMSLVAKRELSRAASSAFGDSCRKLSETSTDCEGSRKVSSRKTKLIQMDDTSLEMFNHMLSNDNEEIYVQDFVASLRGAGLTIKEGLRFAVLVLLEFDLDDSGSIDKEEFVAFCSVSRSLCSIRRDIARFFDFVDVDSNHAIELHEIDTALEYLGEDVLTETERSVIVSIMQMEDEHSEIETVEFINQVTVSCIKCLVSERQDMTKSTW